MNLTVTLHITQFFVDILCTFLAQLGKTHLELRSR